MIYLNNTETKRIFFKPKIRQFISNSGVGEFRDWVEMPDLKIVPDILSFQLDKWNKMFDEI